MSDRFFQGSEPYSLVVDITPELASRWLGDHNHHNRKLVDAHVDRLAREMKAGHWRLTHQGIAFSSRGLLLDGQHRLWAVVLSDTTVPMRVFFNEAPESLGSIDAVRARSNDEILSLGGEIGVVTKSELATLRAMLAGLGNYDRMLAGEEGKLLRRHRRAVQFAHKVLPAARFRGVATAVTRGVLARAFYAADHRRLRHFADVLQSGVASCDEDQPITVLLKFLIDSACGRRGRPEVRERYAKTERALSAYLAGEQINRLYATSMELFPLPAGTVAA
jgi:hypothetical protein